MTGFGGAPGEERRDARAGQDRPPNFRADDGRLYLVRCFACGGERGRENYVLAVAPGVCVTAGVCAWCGWSEARGAQAEPSTAPEGGSA